MGRITLAWEHGEGYGHASRLLPIARELRERGHEVSFVAMRLRETDEVLAGHGFPLLQAPMFWRGTQAPLKKTPTLAAILVDHGYASAETLRPLHVGWRDTLDVLRTELVVCDHSPTAQLAARTLGIPKANLSAGFATPPPVTPLPELLPWNPSPMRERAAFEGRALSSINTILTEAGLRPVASLADFFAAEADLLCTFPEIDHYGARDEGLYCGPIIGSFGEEEPIWPEVEGKRIFGYIKRNMWDFDSTVRQVASLRLPTLLHVAGLDEAEAHRLGTETMRLSGRPYDLSRAVAASDLMICPCGHGTVISTMLAGCPMLLVPQQPEQRLLAERLVELGVALIAGYRRGERHDYAGPARRLLDEPEFSENAKAIAGRHAGYDHERVIRVIVDRLEAILGGQAGDPGPSS